MLKLHKLFDTTTTNVTFHNTILPTPQQRDKLVDAKNKIRDHLRPDIEAASVLALGMQRKVTPRFRTQGSWSYRTCVQPAHQPPQEMDWDFGVYLPIELWQESGPPHQMAKAYFQLVEKSLARLCVKESWKLVQGKAAKNTCIRVQIDDTAHIDVPLYAAPATKFAQIVEASMTKSFSDSDSPENYLREEAQFGELIGQTWDNLLDDIYLAQRDGEWKKSDPARVSRWFYDCYIKSGVPGGQQLLRICLYMKAWRDFQWEEGGPTSVAIMIAVCQGFQPMPGRDDLALEAAAKRLAIAITGQISEFAIDDGEEDFNRLSDAERSTASALASALASAVSSARTTLSANRNLVVGILRAELGDRVPFNLDAIEVEASAGATRVREEPAKIVPAPIVGRSEAG